MARAIVQQFSDPGADRAFSVDEIDKAFLEIAGLLNGGITLDNVDPAQKFSFLAGAGCVQYCSPNWLSHYEMHGEYANSINGSSVVIGTVPVNSYLIGVSAVLTGGGALGNNLTLNLGATSVVFTPKAMDDALKDLYGWGSHRPASVLAQAGDGLMQYVLAGTMVTASGPWLYSNHPRISLMFATSVVA